MDEMEVFTLMLSRLKQRRSKKREPRFEKTRDFALKLKLHEMKIQFL